MTVRDAVLRAVWLAGTRGAAGLAIKTFLMGRHPAGCSTKDCRAALTELESIMQELREELRAIDGR